MERAAGGDIGVQDAEGADGFRARVGEEGIGERLAAGEVGEDRGGVVGDGGDANAAAFELLSLLSQLDQLGFAVGSPVGRTHEGEQEAVAAGEGAEVAGAAGLIGEAEGRDAGAGGGSGGEVFAGGGEWAKARGGGLRGEGHAGGGERHDDFVCLHMRRNLTVTIALNRLYIPGNERFFEMKGIV